MTGYPTLKVFRKGKATEYKGERNEEGRLQIQDVLAGLLSRDVLVTHKSMSMSPNDIMYKIAFFPNFLNNSYIVKGNMKGNLLT